MKPRKLLLLTYHFPPCAAVAVHRMMGLVRNLPQFGWHSVVVAPPNPPHEPTDPALSKLVPRDSTTVISVPFAEGTWGKINRKFLPNVLWKQQAYRACVRAIREHRPDAVYTSLPPECMHELGLSIKKRFGLPWIACFRDPWSVLRRDVPGPPWCWFNARKEAKTMRLADRAVGISPIYSEGLREAYPRYADKIVTITNGYDPDLFPEGVAPPRRDRLSILYTGELYFGRDPRPFLDALKELEASPPDGMPRVGFQFLGRWSDEVGDLPTQVSRRGLESAVTVGGLVPYRDCLRTMQQADILLLIHTPGYAHGLPAKIFEYLGARRPVLVLADHAGDIGWVLKESGVLHRIAPLQDVGRIKQAIVELVREVDRGTPTVSPGFEGASFTRANMARQVADLLDRIVSPAAASTALADRVGVS